MKRFAKCTVFLIAAALLLSGCNSEAANASDEQSGISLVMENSSNKRFSCEFDNVKCSLNEPFGLEFKYADEYGFWLAGGIDEPICVTLQYAETTSGIDKEIDLLAKSEKKTGELAVDRLDIKKTDSGQDILAFSQYVYNSEEKAISYSLLADCGNGRGIMLSVIFNGERSTPEALEETLALFRSLKWEQTDKKSSPKTSSFEFEDVKFTMNIPEDVSYSSCSYPIENDNFSRAVMFVGDAPVTMSYYECANGGTFEKYKNEVLKNIEALSGGNMRTVDPLDPFFTKDGTYAYKWTYRADGLLNAEAFYPIDETSWIAVSFNIGDESRLKDFEKSLKSFAFLKKPEPKYAVLDLSKSERPEVSQVKINCNARLNNLYKAHILHTGVVGLFGCPVEIDGKIPDKTALEFTYNSSMLNGINPDGLLILHYSEEKSDYTELPSKVDKERCTVTAEISEGGAYMLVDAYEWFRAWGVNIDELKHDTTFHCTEITPNFSISIPSDVDYAPCIASLKDSSEPNLREKDLVAGASRYDEKRKIVLTMKYCEGTNGLTYAENIAGAKSVCEIMPEAYSVYEESADRAIFVCNFAGEPAKNIDGTGGVWAFVKITDSSWLYISYSYDYNNISKYEQAAVNSVKSLKWK